MSGAWRGTVREKPKAGTAEQFPTYPPFNLNLFLLHSSHTTTIIIGRSPFYNPGSPLPTLKHYSLAGVLHA